MERLHAYIEKQKPRINQALDRLLPRDDVAPETLHEAMRGSVLGGGKRFRPLLVLMGAEACGEQDAQAALGVGCALEMIHAYSLIHDDLPCMDDAEMRRGKLACHKAFGEAMAVLAGDALLTLAFEVAGEYLPPARAAEGVVLLAQAAGSVGMVGGQVLDLEGEGKELDLEAILAIDRWKTGALITASCEIGAVVAGGSPEARQALREYGRAIGVMYQITDDLLDIEATTEALGKNAGQDARLGKATYPALLGIDESRERAREMAVEAKEALKGFGKEALMLRLLADYILERKK